MTVSTPARVYLDSNVLIYLLEDSPTWGARAGALLRACASRQVDAVVGDAVVAEVMVGALRSPGEELSRQTAELFSDGPLAVVSHDRSMFLEAARIRAQLGGQLLDALHIATAMAAGCDAVISHDARMPRLTEMPVLRLDEIEL